MKNYLLGLGGIIVLVAAVWLIGAVIMEYPLQFLICLVIACIIFAFLKKRVKFVGSPMGQLRERIKKFKGADQHEEKDKQLIIKYMKAYPDALSRKSAFAHLTASAWIVNKEKTKVVMVHHNQFNSWSWAGGHADGTSDLLAVAMKEVAEETGLRNIEPLKEDIFSVEVIGVQGKMMVNREYLPAHLHLNVTYLFQADENDELRPKPNENSDVRWVSVSEIPQIVSEPWMLEIYNKLVERAKSVPAKEIIKEVAIEDIPTEESNAPVAKSFDSKIAPEDQPMTVESLQKIQNDIQAEILRGIVKGELDEETKQRMKNDENARILRGLVNNPDETERPGAKPKSKTILHEVDS